MYQCENHAHERGFAGTGLAQYRRATAGIEIEIQRINHRFRLPCRKHTTHF